MSPTGVFAFFFSTVVELVRAGGVIPSRRGVGGFGKSDSSYDRSGGRRRGEVVTTGDPLSE